MKKVLPLFTLLILSSVIAKAQLESINLNKYKLKDYRYGSLGTNLSLDGNYTKEDESMYNTGFFQNKSLNSTFNANYSLNISNKNYIGSHSLSSSYSHSFKNSSENTTNEIEDKFTNYHLDISTSNSFYINKKLYWGLNLKSSNYQQKMDTKRISIYEPNTVENNNILVSNNKLSFQIGYGRIENVTNLRQAIYILDDLNKKNRLTHESTQEEAFEFADFITTVLNKRVIDSREKRINEYTLIDSFLVSRGLVSKNDGKYFGVLNDNWNYSRAQTWLTGSRVYFGIVSQLNDRHEFSKNSNSYYPNETMQYTQEMINKRIGLETGCEVSWIKGLKWVNNINCNLTLLIDHFNPYNSNDPDSEQNQKLSGLESNISYSLSFVPNNRTILTSNTGVFLTFSKDTYDLKQINISPNSTISCIYYFSQKLQVNAYTQLTYFKSKSKFENQDVGTYESAKIFFGVNLNYYFF